MASLGMSTRQDITVGHHRTYLVVCISADLATGLRVLRKTCVRVNLYASLGEPHFLGVRKSHPWQFPGVAPRLLQLCPSSPPNSAVPQLLNGLSRRRRSVYRLPVCAGLRPCQLCFHHGASLFPVSPNIQIDLSLPSSQKPAKHLSPLAEEQLRVLGSWVDGAEGRHTRR